MGDENVRTRLVADMSVQTVYCNRSFFEQSFAQRRVSVSYDIAYSIMKKISDVYIDIPETDFKQKVMEEEPYRTLFRRESYSFTNISDVQGKIATAEADDIFFMDIPKKEAEQIKETKGVLVVTSNDIYVLDRIANRQFRPYNLAPAAIRKKSPEEFEQIDSWAEVFNEINIAPVNAIAITDNFMFNEKFDERKKCSLFAILKSIVPNNLDIPFHVTIFYNNSNNSLPKDKAESIIQEIRDLEICKNIQISIVCHVCKCTTHDRELLSNYHYMYSGAGFSVIDDNGVQEVAKGVVESVYHGINNIAGATSIKHLHFQVIEWLKLIYTKKKGMNAPVCYIAGDQFYNRLFL